MIKDRLDPNVEFVSADQGGTNQDGTVIWTIRNVEAGRDLCGADGGHAAVDALLYREKAPRFRKMAAAEAETGAEAETAVEPEAETEPESAAEIKKPLIISGFFVLTV